MLGVLLRAYISPESLTEIELHATTKITTRYSCFDMVESNRTGYRIPIGNVRQLPLAKPAKQHARIPYAKILIVINRFKRLVNKTRTS